VSDAAAPARATALRAPPCRHVSCTALWPKPLNNPPGVLKSPPPCPPKQLLHTLAAPWTHPPTHPRLRPATRPPARRYPYDCPADRLLDVSWHRTPNDVQGSFANFLMRPTLGGLVEVGQGQGCVWGGGGGGGGA
jgi:hypothetical protein